MLAVAVATILISKAVLVHGGIAFEVRLDARAAHPLQIWRNDHKLAEGLLKSFHPWALQIVDVDGDDVDEIAVGVTKSTPNLRFPHKTLFIMRFDGHEIYRKWTGSTMGRPLLEFCFSPKERGKPQVLFTLEKTMDGQVALSANKWIGFGFQKIGVQRSWRNAQGLRCQETSLYSA